jgi:hypothetical protein
MDHVGLVCVCVFGGGDPASLREWNPNFSSLDGALVGLGECLSVDEIFSGVRAFLISLQHPRRALPFLSR